LGAHRNAKSHDEHCCLQRREPVDELERRRAPATTEIKNAVKVLRRDGARRLPMHGEVLVHLLPITDLPQELDQQGEPPERRHHPGRLAQKHFLFSPK